MKKLLFVLMIALSAVVFAFTAFAAEAEVDGVWYTLDSDGTATVNQTNKTTTTTIATIPSTITVGDTTYTVDAIDSSAFSGNKNVVEIRILSEHITKIPYAMISNTYDGALEKIYIDFSNIVEIASAGLNPSNQTNGNGPMLNNFYYYDAKAFIENGEDVVIACPDFSSCKSIGAAAFQGARFTELVIPESVYLDNQIFRYSTVQKLTVQGAARESISYYVFNGCTSLREVRIESRNLKSISNDVFSGCTAMEKIYIDLSKCESIGGSTFQMGIGGYDKGNTRVEWYDLEGNRRVDLSSVKTLSNTAFASSNLGGSGATEITWPRALDSIGGQVFRKCNITGTIYINASEGKSLTMEYWAFEGNSPSLVICGVGITKIEVAFTSQCTVVCLDPNVNMTNSDGTFRVSGSTLYAKSTATIANPKNVTRYDISSGTVSYSATCGITADVVTADGAVTLGTATHNFVVGEYDNSYCPIDTFKTHTCSKCNASKLVSDIEGLAPKAHDHSIIVDIVYIDYTENGTYKFKCSECESTLTEAEPSALALITFYGYSAKEGDGGSICIGYEANLDAIDAYRVYNPDFKYGVIAYVPTAQDTSLKLINDDYTLVNPEYTIFTEIESTPSFEFVIRGFGIEHADLALVMCAYVYDGKNASYLNLNQESLEFKQESEAKTVTLNGFVA